MGGLPSFTPSGDPFGMLVYEEEKEYVGFTSVDKYKMKVYVDDKGNYVLYEHNKKVGSWDTFERLVKDNGIDVSKGKCYSLKQAKKKADLHKTSFRLWLSTKKK